MFSQKCRNKMPEDAGFCQKCGSKLVVGAVSPLLPVEPIPASVPQSPQQTPTAPVSTAVYSPCVSVPTTGFRKFVDNHVRTTTKFRSAEELLKKNKSCKFVWLNVIPLLVFIVAAYIAKIKTFTIEKKAFSRKDDDRGLSVAKNNVIYSYWRV